MFVVYRLVDNNHFYEDFYPVEGLANDKVEELLKTADENTAFVVKRFPLSLLQFFEGAQRYDDGYIYELAFKVNRGQSIYNTKDGSPERVMFDIPDGVGYYYVGRKPTPEEEPYVKYSQIGLINCDIEYAAKRLDHSLKLKERYGE